MSGEHSSGELHNNTPYFGSQSSIPRIEVGAWNHCGEGPDREYLEGPKNQGRGCVQPGGICALAFVSLSPPSFLLLALRRPQLEVLMSSTLQSRNPSALRVGNHLVCVYVARIMLLTRALTMDSSRQAPRSASIFLSISR
jgi:hypothetical protein